MCVCEVGVLASVGMCTDEIAAGQYRAIAANKAVSIEVIKTTEDSGELIHL